MASSLCKCGTIRERRTAGPSAKFPGRAYYSCQDCNAFDWAGSSPSKLFDTTTGPECRCGKASIQKRVKKQSSLHYGKLFWSCASWPRGCNFFELCKEEAKKDNSSSDYTPKVLKFASPERKRPPLPGYCTYLSDWNKFNLIEKLMEVDPTFISQIAHVRSRDYDKLEVVGLWKISNPVRKEKFDQAKERIKSSSPKVSSYRFSSSYQDVINQLGADSLDSQAGEVFLMHGTQTENLHGILFEGLDPEFAHNGHFGRGIYFAENATKIDQYATTDRRYEKEGKVGELHSEIYKRMLHSHNVRYALVSRVLLGRHVETMDGKTILCTEEKEGVDNNKYVFTNKHRSALACLDDGTTTPSSLIGVPGGRVNHFREFIVFHGDQVFVEYLVAYKRVRSLCNCKLPVMERTVCKQSENYGRKIHFCGNENENDRCGFIQMFPLCDCGNSCSVKTSQSPKNPNRKYFSCKKKKTYGGCDFFEWKDTAASSSPHKRVRTCSNIQYSRYLSEP